MRLRPIRLSEELEGKILLTLVDSCTSTTQLARCLRRPLGHIQRELIHLHHLGIIRIVALRIEDDDGTARGYDRDYIWELTRHGLDHSDHHPRCWACAQREHRLLLADEEEWREYVDRAAFA